MITYFAIGWAGFIFGFIAGAAWATAIAKRQIREGLQTLRRKYGCVERHIH